MYRLALLPLFCALSLSATTLERLSLDEMIAKSTEIVRGKVTATNASFRGAAGRNGMIYTHYTVAVSEHWKGNTGSTVDVAVPGGTASGYRQVFSGSPTLKVGDEFVFFLWTSRSGLTQVIGLTQGLFSLKTDASGNQVLARDASSEEMIDPASGKRVNAAAVTFGLAELRQRVQRASVEK